MVPFALVPNDLSASAQLLLRVLAGGRDGEVFLAGLPPLSSSPCAHATYLLVAPNLCVSGVSCVRGQLLVQFLACKGALPWSLPASEIQSGVVGVILG